ACARPPRAHRQPAVQPVVALRARVHPARRLPRRLAGLRLRVRGGELHRAEVHQAVAARARAPDPVSRIHVLARDNGAGLSRDLAILTTGLAAAGHEVCASGIGAGGVRRAWTLARRRAGLAWRRWRGGPARFDLNLMLERVRPEYFPLARLNALMPNPEWFADA